MSGRFWIKRERFEVEGAGECERVECWEYFSEDGENLVCAFESFTPGELDCIAEAWRLGNHPGRALIQTAARTFAPIVGLDVPDPELPNGVVQEIDAARELDDSADELDFTRYCCIVVKAPDSGEVFYYRTARDTWHRDREQAVKFHPERVSAEVDRLRALLGLSWLVVASQPIA